MEIIWEPTLLYIIPMIISWYVAYLAITKITDDHDAKFFFVYAIILSFVPVVNIIVVIVCLLWLLANKIRIKNKN